MRTVGFILVGIKEDEMKFVGEDQASGGYIFFSEYMSSAKIFNEYSTCQERNRFWSEQAHNYLQGFKLEVKRLYIY